MITENLAIRAKTFELKISQHLLALFLQYTFGFNKLIKCTSQFFEWQTISQCSVCVSKCMLLHQIIRLLTVCSCHVTYAFQSESTLYSCL